MDRVWQLKSESLDVSRTMSPPPRLPVPPATQDPLLTPSLHGLLASDATGLANKDSAQPDGATPEPKQEEEEDHTQLRLLYQSPPPLVPDGGYGWVVVVGSLLISFLVEGVAYSFAFFYGTWLQEFNTSISQVSWCGSLLTGFYQLTGPFASALANKYGCRRVCMWGALIASSAFVIASNAQNFTVLIISYGVAGGIGFGLMFLPAVIVVGLYFDKRRAFATGLSVCGTGLSGLVMPQIIPLLLEYYMWRGTMLLIAGLVLNGMVFGALFKPPPQPKPPRDDFYDPSTEPSHIIKCILAEKRRCATTSQHSLDDVIITRDNNIFSADAAEVVHPRTLSFVLKLRQEVFSSASPQQAATSVPNLPPLRASPRNSITLRLPTIHQGAVFNSQQHMVRRASARPDELRRRALRNMSVVRLREESSQQLSTELQRPLTRSDIFLSHVNLDAEQQTAVLVEHDQASPSSPLGTNTPSSGGSTPTSTLRYQQHQPVHSVLIVPGVLKPSQIAFAVHGQRSVREGLGELLGSAMLKSLTFIFLCLAGVFAMLGFFIPMLHLPELTRNVVEEGYFNGNHIKYMQTIFTLFCFSNTLGRIFSGLIADRKWANPLVINNVCLLLAGGSILSMPFCRSLPQLGAAFCLFGLFVAAFISLRSIILVQLFGIERLTNGFGLLLLFQGAASLIGPPLTGRFVEMTMDPKLAYYITGAMIITSGLLGLPIEYIRRWELKHRPGLVVPPGYCCDDDDDYDCPKPPYKSNESLSCQSERLLNTAEPAANAASSEAAVDSCYSTWSQQHQASAV